MKPPPFAYRAPESVPEALEWLAEYGPEAKVLAGGQSLVPLLALRLARPGLLVDLARVPGLTQLAERDQGLVVGAMTRQQSAERSQLVGRLAPLLQAAMPFIGHPAIRSRGTIGGSLAHADPAAELPAVAVALDADLVAVSARRGERTIAATEFFASYLTTALEADEILTEIRFPPPAEGTGVGFLEVARRQGDFAMVGVAATVCLRGGSISQARLALTGVADVPIRATEAERALLGAAPDPAAFRAAAEVVALELAPRSDLHASAGYRRQVAAVLVRRALAVAAQRAAVLNSQLGLGLEATG